MIRQRSYVSGGLFVPGGANALSLQAAIEAAANTTTPLTLGAGTFLVDDIVSYDEGLNPPNTVLLGFPAGGGGKTLVMHGASKWLTIIQGATDDVNAEIIFRFRGGTGTNTGRIEISDMAFHVGTIEATRPLLSITGNSQMDIRNVKTQGSYDLTYGGGMGQTGAMTGVLADSEFFWSAGPGVNFGAGLDAGRTVKEGVHPTRLRIIRCLVYCSVSHAFNIHGNEAGEITDCIGWHDIARFGYLKSNAGLRGGNTGRGVRWVGNELYGYYRGGQMNDVLDAVISSNIFAQCGGPGFVLGAKNSGSCGNIIFGPNTYRDMARLLGRPQPASDSDDDDGDTGTIGTEACGLLISGGESVTVGPQTIESDFRRLGYGTITTTAGSTSVALVDNVNQGSQMGTGLACNFPGDILYQDDDGDTPSFLGRIAVGGIGTRTFKSGTDGTGDDLDTVAYLSEPADRVNEPYVIATITGITAANPAVVTTSAPHGFTTGKSIWTRGVTGTMSAINGQWRTCTKISDSTYSLGFNGSGLVYGGGGTSQKGAGSAIQTITLDGGAMASLSAAAYRVRWLEETSIRTGVVREAPSDVAGTTAIVPLQEPNYFVPGSGDIIVTTAGTGVTTSSGTPAFNTVVKPYLDDSIICVLYGYEGAVTTGTKLTLGVFSTATTSTGATLTGNALRTYTGPWCYSIENKMRYGLIVGDQTDYENRARRVTVDWDHLTVRGAAINLAHIYGECIASNNMPTVTVTVPAQTVSGPVDIVTIPPVLPRGRQRMWRVLFQFKDTVAGHATDYATATVSRDRAGTVAAITGMSAVALTQAAATAGSRLTIDGPAQSNDSIADANLFKVNERDLVVISLDKAGAGGAVPEMVVTIEMLWW